MIGECQLAARLTSSSEQPNFTKKAPQTGDQSALSSWRALLLGGITHLGVEQSCFSPGTFSFGMAVRRR